MNLYYLVCQVVVSTAVGAMCCTRYDNH